MDVKFSEHMRDKLQYPHYCVTEQIETSQHKRRIKSDLHSQSDDTSGMGADDLLNMIKF